MTEQQFYEYIGRLYVEYRELTSNLQQALQKEQQAKTLLGNELKGLQEQLRRVTATPKEPTNQ